MQTKTTEEPLIATRKSIGAFLKSKREEQGLSEEALAKMMEVSRSTISMVEAGIWNFGIDTLSLFDYHLHIKDMNVLKPSGA